MEWRAVVTRWVGSLMKCLADIVMEGPEPVVFRGGCVKWVYGCKVCGWMLSAGLARRKRSSLRECAEKGRPKLADQVGELKQNNRVEGREEKREDYVLEDGRSNKREITRVHIGTSPP
jgi:hypothetical protein